MVVGHTSSSTHTHRSLEEVRKLGGNQMLEGLILKLSLVYKEQPHSQTTPAGASTGGGVGSETSSTPSDTNNQ